MRSLKTTLVTAGATAALLLGATSAAYADTPSGDGVTYAEIVQGTGSNSTDNAAGTSCAAYVNRSLDNLDDGYATFINNNSGFNCLFYLNYATLNDAKYGNWSGYGSYATTPWTLYASSGYSKHTTGVYSFPRSTYKIQACFYLQSKDGSWTGAAHCTWAL